MRNNQPITAIRAKNSVNTGIAFQSYADLVPVYEQYEAAAGAGLDLWKWDNGEYPKAFMINILAWHRLRQLVKLHGADAAHEDAKRKK